MKDKFLSFYHIAAEYREEVDFRIRPVDRGGKIVIIAPHGGGIERGTTELTRAIAGEDFSYYIFEALMKKASQSQELHITSTHFDEPRCLDLVKRFQSSVAIHGCVGVAPIIYAGGRDGDLKEQLVTKLKQRGYDIQYGSGEYAGSFPSNICNRTNSRRGVQLEFSNGFRRLLFDDWRKRDGRRTTTALFERLVSDIRDMLI